MRSWSFFSFEPSHLRHGPPFDMVSERMQLSLRGDGSNLPEALNELGRQHPDRLQAVADAFADFLPGLEHLGSERSLSGRTLLMLREQGFTDPFTQVDLSDGALRLLALLYLAHHPNPPALVCIEEPENGLYPRLIKSMVDVLRSLSRRTQVMLTTHSVTLLNRLLPEETVFVERTGKGSQLIRLDTRQEVLRHIERFGLGDQIRMGQVEEP